MEEKIKELRAAIEEAAAAVTDQAQLSDFWQKFLSKNGAVAGLTKSLRDVPKEERPAAGKTINEFKVWVEGQYQAASAEIEKALSVQVEQAALAARNAAETVDITMPPKVRLNGSLHPITLVKNEIVDVFVLIAGTALSDKDDCTVVYLYDREKKTTTIDVYNTVTGEDLHTYEDILPGRGVEFIKK